MQMLLYKVGDAVCTAVNIENITHITRLMRENFVAIGLTDGKEVTLQVSMEKLLKALYADTNGPITIEAEL